MLFLDPNKPINTCISENCNGCDLRKTLHCHFRPKDLTHFYAIVMPTFLLGGAGVYHISGWLLVLWLFMILGFFGFLEIRVMCSHCPHYGEPSKTLKCWANYGSPKIWRHRPGPMSFVEKFIFFSGITIIWGYPLLFLFMGMQWFLLLVYLLSSGGFFMTLKLFLCSQCTNFACPLNGVADSIRQSFFEKNPELAKAWDVDLKD